MPPDQKAEIANLRDRLPLAQTRQASKRFVLKGLHVSGIADRGDNLSAATVPSRIAFCAVEA